MFGQLAVAQGVEVTADELRAMTIFVAVILIIGAALDIGLGLAVLAGRNWARLALMLFCVFTTITSFVANVRGVDVIGLADLPVVGGSILVLLALSSHRARDYAARGRHLAKEVSAETSASIAP